MEPWHFEALPVKCLQGIFLLTTLTARISEDITSWFAESTQHLWVRENQRPQWGYHKPWVPSLGRRQLKDMPPCKSFFIRSVRRHKNLGTEVPGSVNASKAFWSICTVLGGWNVLDNDQSAKRFSHKLENPDWVLSVLQCSKCRGSMISANWANCTTYNKFQNNSLLVNQIRKHLVMPLAISPCRPDTGCPVQTKISNVWSPVNKAKRNDKFLRWQDFFLARAAGFD